MSSKLDTKYCGPAFSLQTFDGNYAHFCQTVDNTNIATVLGRKIITDKLVSTVRLLDRSTGYFIGRIAS